MIVVLVIQMCVNSASRHFVVLSWIICIVMTNVSLCVDGSSLNSGVNFLLFFLVAVSYEFERHGLRHFMKVRHTR